ncbi:MAG: urease accessory protein UreD [Myxococcales bacterium]|nr:urease accessory protein UreD [Myxococcales bacterium]
MIAHARSSLEVVRSRVTSASVVRRAYAEAPIALSCPRNHGHAAWVFPTVLGPGYLRGDDHEHTIEVREGATAYIGSIGIARGFAGVSSTRVRATVEPSALLVHAPCPLTGAAGADVSQSVEIDLAEGASLVLIDGITRGRPETGERWAFERLRTRLVVRVGGEVVLEDALDLEPGRTSVERHFGAYGGYALALALGPRARSFADAWRDAPPRGRGPTLSSVSTSRDDLVVVRLATQGAADLAQECALLLRNLRETLGDDPLARRPS